MLLNELFNKTSVEFVDNQRAVFTAGGEEYTVRFQPTRPNTYHVTFFLTAKESDPDAFANTGKGIGIEILSNAMEATKQFIGRVKPDTVMFIAEPKRMRIYKKMLSKVIADYPNMMVSEFDGDKVMISSVQAPKGSAEASKEDAFEVVDKFTELANDAEDQLLDSDPSDEVHAKFTRFLTYSDKLQKQLDSDGADFEKITKSAHRAIEMLDQFMQSIEV